MLFLVPSPKILLPSVINSCDYTNPFRINPQGAFWGQVNSGVVLVLLRVLFLPISLVIVWCMIQPVQLGVSCMLLWGQRRKLIGWEKQCIQIIKHCYMWAEGLLHRWPASQCPPCLRSGMLSGHIYPSMPNYSKFSWIWVYQKLENMGKYRIRNNPH